MRTALIGHTGFVGSNLLRQARFDARYNSKNIAAIAGERFDLVVCAGTPGTKWIANKNPEGDRDSVSRLTDALRQVTTDHLVLISTVDVYPDPVEVDEDSPIAVDRQHAYGRHRLHLENFVAEQFESTILRLPGLFGSGLQKNVIFDLLHDHEVEKIRPDSQYQFYDVGELWTDIARTREIGVHRLNLATEPILVRDLASYAFGLELPDSPDDTPAARYDMRSKHARRLGGTGHYIYDRRQVLAAMRTYVEREGWRRP